MSDVMGIVVKADTMDEALQKAEGMLQVSRSKLRIETLNKGSKGVFGFGKKQVVIRAALNGFADLEQFIERSLEGMPKTSDATEIENEDIVNMNGCLEIRNSKVIFTKPQGFGKYPCLVPGPNVTVKVDGKEINQQTVITEEDRVELTPLVTTPMEALEIVLSDDRLHARLKIQRLSGKQYTITDSKPAQTVRIETTCVTEEAAMVTYDDIKREMDKNSIVYGINEKAIEEAVGFQGETLELEIATGVTPSGAVDGQIKYNFLEENFEFSRNPYGEGKILSVDIGQVLAIKTPPKEGVPGIDVTGRQVPSPKPKDVEILFKEGIQLVENGTVAIATIAGRPVLEGQRNKYLSVRPIYYVNGDVDLAVGNITYNGDIVITGNVLDGFRLEAGGNVEVHGDVVHATIYALGDVNIHGKAITATIQAGGPTSTYQHVADILEGLQSRVKELIQACEVLRKQDTFTTSNLRQSGEGQIVQLLIDVKFKDIPKTIDKLDELLVKGNAVFWPELVDLSRVLGGKFLNLGPLRIKDRKELETLVGLIEHEIIALDRSLQESADVIVSYVQNSRIRAARNIRITGEGAITTELDAGAQISIASVVRGGTLTSRERISVEEIGSAADVETHVKLLGSCKLDARLAHSGVVIHYGAERQEVLEDCEGLRAHGEKNRIVLETY